ncbi:hypothetical protein AVEN_263223-1 [Araneus ventricosus]|uniref:Transcriptional coactivator p15 (PC4) C-terminal domain-containing protein n=1 Tax=Araneus ventricosus TaxID=182803 RepID=A0A4Y2X933_ARAVE|nr:hypothetical protein AVEN_263223-1 [Araneus ventricosus]
MRKLRTDENGRIFPTKNGVSFSPSVWETLSNQMHRLPIPSNLEQAIIIRNTLFRTSECIENVPCVSLHRYVTKQDFSRQILPSVCLLTETEWYQRQCIREKISDSCKSLMFNNFLKKKILLEVSSLSPRTNLQMELSDVKIMISMSLRELLADNIKSRI